MRRASSSPRSRNRAGIERVNRDKAGERQQIVDPAEQGVGMVGALVAVHRDDDAARRGGHGSARDEIGDRFEKAQRVIAFARRSSPPGKDGGLRRRRRRRRGARLRRPCRATDVHFASPPFDIARLMGDGLLDFVALGRDILVEQAGRMDQRLHEIMARHMFRPRSARASSAKSRAASGQPVEVALQEIGGLARRSSRRWRSGRAGRLFAASQARPLSAAKLRRKAAAGASGLEGVKPAQRGQQPADGSARFVEVAGRDP